MSPKVKKKAAKVHRRIQKKAKPKKKKAGGLNRSSHGQQSPPLLAVEHKQITDARPDLSIMLRNVENQNAKYTVGRRDKRAALMVSYVWIAPVLSQDKPSEMAFLIVNRLLKDAPLHLTSPAIKELSQLSKEDLTLLFWAIDKFPLNRKKAEEIRAKMQNPNVLDRLLKRFDITRAISAAQEEGLYESAEHLTSQTVLDEDQKGIQAEAAKK